MAKKTTKRETTIYVIDDNYERGPVRLEAYTAVATAKQVKTTDKHGAGRAYNYRNTIPIDEVCETVEAAVGRWRARVEMRLEAAKQNVERLEALLAMDVQTEEGS